MAGSNSRVASRLHVIPRALSTRFLQARSKPLIPERILIAHHLLLGDTLMTTPLIARLRAHYPQARIVMTMNPTYLPLYAGKPYGIEPVAYDPRDAKTVKALTASGPFDLACVPGENRYALTAAAAGAKWIVAFGGDRPAWKNKACDELVDLPETQMTIDDMFALLAAEDAPTVTYDPAQWPDPPCAPFELPQQPYAVLHVGSGSKERRWDAANWRTLAFNLKKAGIEVIISAGPAERAIADEISQHGTYKNYAGTINLAQLWHLVKGAKLLVCPDTGVAHLAKLTNTPTVCLFGPGGEALFGRGKFFADAPFQGVTIPTFPDRHDAVVFKRRMPWGGSFPSAKTDTPEATFARVNNAALEMLKRF